MGQQTTGTRSAKHAVMMWRWQISFTAYLFATEFPAEFSFVEFWAAEFGVASVCCHERRKNPLALLKKSVSLRYQPALLRTLFYS